MSDITDTPPRIAVMREATFHYVDTRHRHRGPFTSRLVLREVSMGQTQSHRIAFTNERGNYQPFHGDWVLHDGGRRLRLSNFHCLGGRPRTVQLVKTSSAEDLRIGQTFVCDHLPVAVEVNELREISVNVRNALVDEPEYELLDSINLFFR